ncbi:MAG: aminotransferase class V-fold PLP-dependent enzyme [Candidatus Thorarchaeota archaeon]
MPDIIDPRLLSEMFPSLSDMAYFNNSARGMPPITAFDAMKSYLDDRLYNRGGFEESLRLYKSVRELLATLLGGEVRNYGYVSNTSAGINHIAHSIEYPKNSNIVICDLEFPSNYIPWQNISKLYDVELRVVKSQDGAAPLDAFKELIDDNTRVVAVSHVQFGTGYRHDVVELAKITHKAGGYLVGDPIQSAGYIETDLVKLGVDFAAAQSHKWLIGPIGAGYLYVSDNVIEHTSPKFIGWFGVKNFIDFDYSEREPMEDARKFQLGSPAKIAYVGLEESLKTLLSIPGKDRERAALDNANYLRKRLVENDIECYDFGPKNNSAIVSCVVPDVEELNKELAKDKIICSIRGGRLRVSPHFYNTYEDLERLMVHLE